MKYVFTKKDTLQSLACWCSVPAGGVCWLGLVNAVQPLCQSIVGEVFRLLGSGVVMVVSTLAVVTEAVCVFHSQVKALQENIKRTCANLVSWPHPLSLALSSPFWQKWMWLVRLQYIVYPVYWVDQNWQAQLTIYNHTPNLTCRLPAKASWMSCVMKLLYPWPPVL